MVERSQLQLPSLECFGEKHPVLSRHGRTLRQHIYQSWADIKRSQMSFEISKCQHAVVPQLQLRFIIIQSLLIVNLYIIFYQEAKTIHVFAKVNCSKIKLLIFYVCKINMALPKLLLFFFFYHFL